MDTLRTNRYFQHLLLPALAAFVLASNAADVQTVAGPGDTRKGTATSLLSDRNALGKRDKLVIMLTGNDLVQTRYIEETLALQLLKNGLMVVSRLRVERLLAEEMVKQRTAGEKEVRKAIHATTIAKNAGATRILVGTILVESRSAPARSGDKDQTGRVVKCISLQLVSVDSEDILWAGCQEFDDSVSFTELTSQVAASIGRE